MMKKVCICAILIMVGVLNLKAQKISIEAGVTGGFIHEVTVEGKEKGFSENTNLRYSFVGGVSYEQKLLGGVSVVGGAYYIGKGLKYDYQDQGESEKLNYTFQLPYLELQVLPKFSIGLAGVGAHFMVGPYWAQRIGGKMKMESGGISDDVKCDKFLSKKDFGLTFGLGVRVRCISLTAKYDMGLTNILDNEEYTPGDNYKTMTGSLVLGYSF